MTMELSKRLIVAWKAFRNPTSQIATGGFQAGRPTIDDSPDIVTARVFGKLRRVQLTGIAGPYHLHAQAFDGTMGTYLVSRQDVVESDRLKFAQFADSIRDRHRQ